MSTRPILYLIRGASGSGKTTLARKLRFHGLVHDFIEADQYFLTPEGYKWEGRLLPKARAWCRETTRIMLARGLSVAVSNTSISKQEVGRYVRLAEEFGAELSVTTLTGEFRNEHEVPPETALKQRKNLVPIDDFPDLAIKWFPVVLPDLVRKGVED